MFRENIMTFVRYFRRLIDDEWERLPAAMSEHERARHILSTQWRSLPKDLRKNGYRRRLWRRLVDEKVERRQDIKRIRSRGIVPGWLRCSMGDR